MNIKLLKKLCSTFGVSGDETLISNVIKDIMTPLCDKMETDKYGNIYCYKISDVNAPTVMIDAHVDTVGFIVKKIFDRGFIQFETVGGIDAKILPGTEVVIKGKELVKGVVASKPPHLMNEKDKENVPKISEMYIDTGFSDQKAEKFISVGDLISFSPFCELMGKCVTGTYLDNRLGSMAIVDIFSKLIDVKLPFNLVGVFSRQEEIGLVGADFLNIQPDLCVVIDVTHGMTPDEKSDEVFKCGNGTAIGVGPNINRFYYDYVKTLCEYEKLLYQTEVLERNSGTNAWKYQLSNLGVPCLLLSVPIKFMHTSVETASVADYDNLVSISELLLKSLDNEILKVKSELIKIK